MTKEQALPLLQQMIGEGATFRDGQWEVIDTIVNKRQRLLVVQRTGWGKSLVYFLATRLLRDQNRGPTLLISPLLSLMRNQILMAEKIGVSAATINSANQKEWSAIETKLQNEEVDILLISPERLNNEHFLAKILPAMQSRIGLFVVDEAHCISDWGHDFRPDYQRIVRIVQQLPKTVSVLALTATANDRVVNDTVKQLSKDLQTSRGPLMREGLRLRNIILDEQDERLAWLAENLPKLPGSGIIYCLTVADSVRVANWLQQRGLAVLAYNADMSTEERIAAEDALLANQVKALSATVALGMGFDKPDLYFVIHFQRPGNIVAYYQQVGRAGRALKTSVGILLAGKEDDRILNHFIDSAFAPPDVMEEILLVLEKSEGLTIRALQSHINCSFSMLEKALRLLEIDGALIKKKSAFHRSLNPWTANRAHYERITLNRRLELEKMKEYVKTHECLMAFLVRELSDPHAHACGRCANCSTPTLPNRVSDPELLEAARQFLRNDFQIITPRHQWPAEVHLGSAGNIPVDLQNQEGRALSIYDDPGWGKLVAQGKYRDKRFSDILVSAAAELITQKWKPKPFPRFVTAVPSLRAVSLVEDFAQRLASVLKIPYTQVISKIRETPPQKRMANSAHQAKNIIDAFVITGNVPSGPCLLVDDIFDSKWTLTILGYKINEKGGGPVFPFTLARAADRKTLE